MKASKLSVLVCGLKRRRSQSKKLLDFLMLKARVNDMEVLREIDNGELTVGAKRQKLLERSAGEYCMFVDDDDSVSSHYFEGIMSALKTNPDCVSIDGIRRNIASGKSIRMRMGLTPHLGMHNRPINHLCPVRRELALATGFADMDCGEDCDYADRLKPLLKTEVNADPNHTRYVYNFDPDKSATWKPAVYANRFGGTFALTLLLKALEPTSIAVELPDASVLREIKHLDIGESLVLRIYSVAPKQPVTVNWHEGAEWRSWASTDSTVELLSSNSGRVMVTSPHYNSVVMRSRDCWVDGKARMIRYTRQGF